MASLSITCHYLTYLTVVYILLIVMLCCHNAVGVLGKSQMCEVETGQTNIILDIEESRGDYVGQHTNPPELPIFGDPFTGIALDLVFPKGQPIFLLNGKRLQLLQPLDRDEENLSHIVFQVSCTIRSSQKRRNIPIIVRVSDVNDNAPRFMNTPYEVTVPEFSNHYVQETYSSAGQFPLPQDKVGKQFKIAAP
uniref:Cadherin domain-containing protein n=1 Tax=Glossina austeni TaxID=7395 RepID=A0A1A9VR35_GLOAU